MPLDPTGGPLLDTGSTLGAGPLSDAMSFLGGAGGAATSPYTLPLTLLLSFLPALFGRRGQKDMTSLINYLKPTQPIYMSPNLPALDKTTYNAVINQLGRTQNWGWPGAR